MVRKQVRQTALTGSIPVASSFRESGWSGGADLTPFQFKPARRSAMPSQLQCFD